MKISKVWVLAIDDQADVYHFFPTCEIATEVFREGKYNYRGFGPFPITVHEYETVGEALV